MSGQNHQVAENGPYSPHTSLTGLDLMALSPVYINAKIQNGLQNEKLNLGLKFDRCPFRKCGALLTSDVKPETCLRKSELEAMAVGRMLLSSTMCCVPSQWRLRRDIVIMFCNRNFLLAM